MSYTGKYVALSVERGLFYVDLPGFMLYVWPAGRTVAWTMLGWRGARR